MLPLDTWIPRDCDKEVSWSGQAAEIAMHCEALHAADKRAEQRRRSFIVLAIGGGIAGPVLGGVTGMGWLIGVGLLLALVFGFMAYQANADDLEDRKLEFVRVLVDVLKGELREGSAVEVGLDFRGFWRFESGQTWLTVKMTLDNGVVAQISVQDRCKRKLKQKRKYTKVKDKIVESVIVRLSPPKGQTLDVGLAVGTPAIKVGPLSLRQAKVAPRAATFSFSTKQLVRTCGRGGWMEVARKDVPSGYDAVRALITSYHLLGRAGSRAAAASV